MIKILGLLKEIETPTRKRSIPELESELLATLKNNLSQVKSHFRPHVAKALEDPSEHKDLISSLVDQIHASPAGVADIFGEDAALIAYRIYKLKQNVAEGEGQSEEHMKDQALDLLKKRRDVLSKNIMWFDIFSNDDQYIDDHKDEILYHAIDQVKDGPNTAQRTFGPELVNLLLKLGEHV